MFKNATFSHSVSGCLRGYKKLDNFNIPAVKQPERIAFNKFFCSGKFALGNVETQRVYIISAPYQQNNGKFCVSI